MFDLRKLFLRELRARKVQDHQDPDSDYHPSDRRGEGLEVEYQTLIAQQFRRWGIATGCVTIEVRQIGRAPDGFDVFVGMVRLAQWDRPSALRVLLGLPLLEAKVRKTVRATWLADFSHFGGLWLHASEQLHHSPAMGELRELMLQLVPPSPSAGGQDDGPASSGYSSSSLPPLTPVPVTASSLSPTSGAMPLASISAGDDTPAPT
ncbi:hypothetical protein FN976_22435 [Caenimonas sedimenti]|uniref:Uncharacterized protein n=1 Tax=Caenimonas sedimenti TaxID=2596921 RepID=A0A562ZJ78_9BURK|nr:hypothetical protein [Caenimonas sedimenti]TWO68396.1 hypothetical protein FN976_22435 [Caenimonas sedimenti]